MRRILLYVVFISFCTSALALSFPALTGRVVDDAHILSPSAVEQLEQNLASFEQRSTDQIVVATVPSLDGASIEDYGYQLGRFWGIGQKGKNNGAILLVAPNERKVRIEVGYGLEGTLTDAMSSQIIQTIIVPAFRQGQMETGVIQGAMALVSVLGGEPLTTSSMTMQPEAKNTGGPGEFLLILLWIAIIFIRIFILPWWFPLLFMPSRGGFGISSSSSGGFSGGFSGGGGSFGGGGASGGW